MFKNNFFFSKTESEEGRSVRWYDFHAVPPEGDIGLYNEFIRLFVSSVAEGKVNHIIMQINLKRINHFYIRF